MLLLRQGRWCGSLGRQVQAWWPQCPAKPEERAPKTTKEDSTTNHVEGHEVRVEDARSRHRVAADSESDKPYITEETPQHAKQDDPEADTEMRGPAHGVRELVQRKAKARHLRRA
jgi:hypothetical protein